MFWKASLMGHSGFMLDTVIFNRIRDGNLALSGLRGKALFATHVQRDELEATRDEARRCLLSETFKAVDPSIVPTTSAIFDISRFDEACWTSDDTMHNEIFQRIVELDRLKGKNKPAENQHRDALIAETAIRKDFTLVTDDCALREVAEDKNGRAISYKEFCQLV